MLSGRHELSILFICLLPFVQSLPALWRGRSLDSARQFRRDDPSTQPGYWLDQSEAVLSNMQQQYWNGTYWPSTLQWIGAVINTLLSSENIAFKNALEEYNGNVPGGSDTSSSLNSDIQTHFGDTVDYYGGEDTIQIFGAAYDDAQWVVLEWLEAIKFVNQYDSYASSSLGQNDIAEFAHRAHIFYHIVQNEYNTTLCGGGLTWNPALAVYKNAVTNELFIDSSVGMYLYFPGDNNTDPYPSPNYQSETGQSLPPLPTLQAHDPSLLNSAIEEYNWFRSQAFANSQGLIIDGFHISDGQTTCNEPDTMVYTYNQGILLSGLRQLWEATGNTTYLTDGYQYVNTVIDATGWNNGNWQNVNTWQGLGRNGIIEDYCDAAANCSQDSQTFKGIYFHHLDLFCDPLPTDQALIPGLTYTASASLANTHASNCANYEPWIAHNAQAALMTEDSQGIIGGWWGAPYANNTNGPMSKHAPKLPSGAQDIENRPWLLRQAPWACDGIDCNSNGRGKNSIGQKIKRWAEKRGVNGDGLGRTVQTQASGLGVVQATADFLMKRPAS